MRVRVCAHTRECALWRRGREREAHVALPPRGGRHFAGRYGVVLGLFPRAPHSARLLPVSCPVGQTGRVGLEAPSECGQAIHHRPRPQWPEHCPPRPTPATPAVTRQSCSVLPSAPSREPATFRESRFTAAAEPKGTVPLRALSGTFSLKQAGTCRPLGSASLIVVTLAEHRHSHLLFQLKCAAKPLTTPASTRG